VTRPVASRGVANTDILKRFLDAGASFTQMTRERAEKLVKDLVQLGEVRADETQQAVQELVDRGRESTEQLMTWISTEVRKQMELVASRMDGLEERMDEVGRSLRMRSGPAKKSAAKTAPAKTSTAKKSPAKKSTAKKSPAKKSTAKKSTAKKSTAKRASG
jgi:polyhydroxyalkanoate synthesis regulator phasin